MSATLSIARQQVRLLLSDVGPIIQYLFVPLLLMAILRPSQETLLLQQGFQGANGAEQVIPGIAAWFSFFWVRTIGALFFSEHGWGTWERLQTSFATPLQVMVGKTLPLFVVIALQHLTLFGFGAILFDLDVRGSVLALVPIFLGLNLCVMTMALALVALCRSSEQIHIIGTLLSMLFATLGGALVPSFILPSLAEDLAPATPVYWAVDGARAVILEGEGLSAALAPTAALLAFSALFAIVAAVRFSFADAKVVEG